MTKKILMLSLPWMFGGIFIGVICGTSFYTGGTEYFKEPPPYVVMAFSVLVSVPGGVWWGYVAGAKDAARSSDE